MINKKNADFAFQYGSKELLAKYIKPEIPHWNDLTKESKVHMYGVLNNAVKNPSLTHEMAMKIADFPHLNADYIHTEMLYKHPNLHPNVLEKIASNLGHSDSV